MNSDKTEGDSAEPHKVQTGACASRSMSHKNSILQGNQNANSDWELQEEIREASRRGRAVIMGDFNYPHIDWVNSQSGQNKEVKFLDILNDCALEQLVMEPTREKATLDLILSDTQDLVRDVSVIDPLGNSDHSAIKSSIHAGRESPRISNTDILNFRRGSFSKMRSMVKRKLKGKSRRVTSLQSAWSLLKTTILEAQLDCIPKRRKDTTKSRRMPAWLTGTVKEAIKGKKTSFRNWKACPNEENRKERKLWRCTRGLESSKCNTDFQKGTQGRSRKLQAS
ncbi:uncharacterized protein LOC128335549 [Hemicordylus capensis]|uniref:uncharacterized protein LOC128335549 n=1 Tax=Hemicordylus capensis TaxID=884348 RepID=UPI002303849C|nr:uncharacterized protein LOC128335549 [Hemicordylus capensis]